MDGKESYMQLLFDTRFVLCPAGNNPETFRLYESLEAGHMRLKNMGVKRLHRGEDVTAAVTEIAKDTKTDSVIRHGALAVQELLWRAPWNLTTNFLQASDRQQVMTRLECL